MECQICGKEGSTRRPAKILRLCDDCDRSTPEKLPREVFDALYWAGDAGVKERVRKEFYQDYLTSDLDFGRYLERTMSTEV